MMVQAFRLLSRCSVLVVLFCYSLPSNSSCSSSSCSSSNLPKSEEEAEEDMTLLPSSELIDLLYLSSVDRGDFTRRFKATLIARRDRCSCSSSPSS